MEVTCLEFRPLPHDRQRQLAKGRDWPPYLPPYLTGVKGGGWKPSWRMPPAARRLRGCGLDFQESQNNWTATPKSILGGIPAHPSIPTRPSLPAGFCLILLDLGELCCRGSLLVSEQLLLQTAEASSKLRLPLTG